MGCGGGGGCCEWIRRQKLILFGRGLGGCVVHRQEQTRTEGKDEGIELVKSASVNCFKNRSQKK